ncbi:hypothetical protein [Pseudomonas sp. C2B4]|uniref:hypothetical protein n=1 Tax=Pseudomonas sp. C2B4 TaxID=2735270 RepID=UPI0015867DAD|nr:hypothetical protein [Pseudomonas sp. C2B4]NUU36898.1 hypothetical protein [Pseudomonas sp. C2B4]
MLWRENLSAQDQWPIHSPFPAVEFAMGILAMGKEGLRSEHIQRKRRLDLVANWVATIVVAALMAVVTALLVEGILLLIGALGGNVAWLRSWIDFKFSKLQEWLTALPGLEDVIPVILALLPPDGMKRELVTLIISLFVLALYPAKRAGPALIASYDDETLRAAPGANFGMRWAGPLGDHQKATWSWLQQWCFGGAGSGRSPWLQPWVMPNVDQPFSIAMLVGANGTGKSHLAEAFSRHLDGNDRLCALPGEWARLRLRLRTRLQSWVWWRTRKQSDPWDCGYIVEDSAPRTRLSQFLPRRATLLIADQLLPASLEDCIERLNAQRAEFRHPVRLLVIDVTLPTVLGLKWDACSRLWQTGVLDLGEVPVMNLSAVRFHVPDFRALVNAQMTDPSTRDLELYGVDSRWAPLVDGLEGEPILLTESIRMVREQKLSFESLLSAEDLFGQTVKRQELRTDPPLLPVDMLGKQRELLRERVLSARAEHREKVLRNDLGEVVGNVDEMFEAILIAGVANGGSEARLARLLGWKVQHHLASRMSELFGVPCIRDWVPALSPAVIVDEMLRRHFEVPRDAEMSEGTRQRVVLMMRKAWLLNPAGTLRTAGRWQQRRRRDAFVLAILQLPTLAELERAQKLSLDERVEIVRAYFELAVVYQSNLQQADEALSLLDEQELSSVAPELLALVMRSDARGLPALVLWLRLLHRQWPNLHTMPSGETVAFGCTLIQRTQHLVRQSVICTVPMTSSLRQLLEDAVLAVLPLFGELAMPCAGDPTFQAAANAFWETNRSNLHDKDATDAVPQLSMQLITSVAVQLSSGSRRDMGEPTSWLYAVMEAIAATTRLDADTMPSTGWLAEVQDAKEALSFAWGRARALAVVAFANAGNNDDVTVAAIKCLMEAVSASPGDEGLQWESAEVWRRLTSTYMEREAVATEAAAECVAAIASAFPLHVGIQCASAQVWQCLAWAHQHGDVTGTEAAAMRVAAIASAFPAHEGIQYASAGAWQCLAWAHQRDDVAGTEAAAQRVAAIASAFPAHEGIQYASAGAWQCLAWALQRDDVAGTEAAAQRVAAIASAFPAHEGIQLKSARAWRHLAWAHKNSNAVATEEAARRVAEIASAFPACESIQTENAEAWRYLGWAHRNSDAASTEAAAQRVAAIASAFPASASIQSNSAEAWRNVALAYRNSNAAATEAAAGRAASIASAFLANEGIQCASAEAWQCLAWAHQDNNLAATEAAARRVAAIASEFPASEGIQCASAEAWRCLAWVNKDSNASATEAATERVAAIASKFLKHKKIQHECAVAYRLLAWAQKNHNAAATEEATKRVAAIASEFPSDDGFQYESSQAWWYLAWAHKDSNIDATEAAVERVAEIASRFPEYEDVQHISTQAWGVLVYSAIEFNDEGRVALALKKLDDLCHERDGEMVWRGQPVSGRIRAERERVRSSVKRWRKMRDGSLDDDAAQE